MAKPFQHCLHSTLVYAMQRAITFDKSFTLDGFGEFVTLSRFNIVNKSIILWNNDVPNIFILLFMAWSRAIWTRSQMSFRRVSLLTRPTKLTSHLCNSRVADGCGAYWEMSPICWLSDGNQCNWWKPQAPAITSTNKRSNALITTEIWSARRQRHVLCVLQHFGEKQSNWRKLIKYEAFNFPIISNRNGWHFCGCGHCQHSSDFKHEPFMVHNW